jgi:BA14K-like protein
MSKFAKVLGVFTLAMIVNVGAAQAQHYGGHGGGWHGGGWHGGGYRGGYYGGWGWGGWGWGPYWGPDYYYDYGPPPGDAVAYCMHRFKSYDPRSGTYLGYDGRRHPCP